MIILPLEDRDGLTEYKCNRMAGTITLQGFCSDPTHDDWRIRYQQMNIKCILRERPCKIRKLVWGEFSMYKEAKTES